LSVKINDILKVPLTDLKFPWGIWWGLTTILSLPFGIILWTVTLGGFRYFHLMKKWLDFCVESKLKREGFYGH